MKRNIKKYMGILMLLVMVIAVVIPVRAASFTEEGGNFSEERSTESEGQYSIYPVPRWISYDPEAARQDFQMEPQINVVLETGIDSDTSQFLKEVLEKYGRQMQVSDKLVSGKSNIILGIHGSGKVADQYVKEKVPIQNGTLFEQTDAYLLQAREGTIVILGKDTDAAFYGVATLQMMFSSFGGEHFLNTQIEDYAGMASRGFIEGFYGGWDYAGRESLMKFARDYKMNTYVYASKTDSYHKNDDLYPAAELEKIRKLVQVGKETKVTYAWSIHISYFFNRLNGMTVGSEEYQKAFDENYKKLEVKFGQLYDAGVRKFHVLNDDFGAGSHAEVVRLLNKLDNEFLKPRKCQRMTYCPQGYNKAWSSQQELDVLKNLNASIDLYWTGDDVNSPITQETVDSVTGKTNHAPVFWLNYPVNEHGASGVYLGEISHYARNNVTGLAGAVSNPSRFTETNKVGLFQLAALFWNNTDYEDNAVQIWEAAFSYLQPEVRDAYLTIARNVANCPGSGRVPQGFPESEYLKDTLTQVLEKAEQNLNLGEDEQVRKLVEEFDNILNSIQSFRKNCKNTTLVSELDPWLKSLKDVTEAGKAALEALIRLSASDLDGAWTNLGRAGRFMETENTYPSFKGSDKNALAGSKYLVPFVSKAIILAKNAMIPFLNPDSPEFSPSFYGKMGGKVLENSAESAKLFDGNESTYGSYQIVQAAGDYYGVDMGRVIPVHSIEILQGKNDSDHDYFHNAALEYSKNGTDWTVMVPKVDSHRIQTEDILIKARYIRLRLTEKGTAAKPDYWTFIREFAVNKGSTTGQAVYTNQEAWKNAAVVREDRTYSLQNVNKVQLKHMEYLGVKLPELTSVASVLAEAKEADGLLTLQYSENGVLWTEISEGSSGFQARYVRWINQTEQTIHFDFGSFQVTTASVKIQPSVVETNMGALKEGTWENLFDGNTATHAWTNTPQKEGQYILVDLGVTAPVYDLKITTEDGNPRFYNAKIQASTDKINWEDVAAVTDGGGDAVRENIFYHISKNLSGKQVRYLRILITGNSGYFLKINEFAINKTVQSESSVLSGNISGGLDKMIDGNISTVYISGAPSDGNAYVKYQITDQTKVKSVTILQDGEAITHAQVKAGIYDGSQVTESVLGNLDSGSTTFALDGEKDLLYLNILWPKGTVPVVYEIFTSVDNAGGGSGAETVFPQGKHLYKLGQESFPGITVSQDTEFKDLNLPESIQVFYQDGSTENLQIQWSPKGYTKGEKGIYTLSGKPGLTGDTYNFAGLSAKIEVTVEESQNPVLPDLEYGNLALQSPVEESGTGLYPCKNAVDGNEETRWEGSEIKGGAVQNTSWLMVDLGSKPVKADQILVKFYLKTYATDYEIQVSQDKKEWASVETRTNPNGDVKDLTDTFELEQPVTQRYVRFFFRKMNTNAAGNAVGIREVQIMGSRGAYVDPDPKPECTCTINNLSFQGGSAVLSPENPSAVFLLNASAEKGGDCTVAGHQNEEPVFTYELLNSAGLTAALEGNILTVTEPESIQVQVTAKILGAEKAEERETAVFEVSRQIPPTVTYTVSFSGGAGASGPAPESLKAEQGEEILLPENTFSCTGYQFEGWNDGNQTVYPALSPYKMPGKDIAFTAVWKPIPQPEKKTRLIYFDSRGGTAAGSIKKEEGENLGKLPVPVRKQYTFTGWFTAAAGGIRISDNSVCNFKKDTTLYAQWKENAPAEPAKVTRLKMTRYGSDSISISWNKVPGANGYVVYRYNQASRKWDRIAAASSGSYRDKKRKSATVYQYKVRAYRQTGTAKVYGKDSDILFTGTSPIKPNLKSVKRAGNAAVVKWTKTTRADGYEVYMKTGRGKFKRIAVKSGKTFSYKKMKLKSKVTYSFKIRSYKKIKNVKSYSPYSKTINFKL